MPCEAGTKQAVAAAEAADVLVPATGYGFRAPTPDSGSQGFPTWSEACDRHSPRQPCARHRAEQRLRFCEVKDRERLKAKTSSERPFPHTGRPVRLPGSSSCAAWCAPVAVEALAHKTLNGLVDKGPTVATCIPPVQPGAHDPGLRLCRGPHPEAPGGGLHSVAPSSAS